MDISSNTSSIQTLAPRTQQLPTAEEVGRSSTQTPPNSETRSPDQDATPRVEAQAQASAPTTDLNDLLLRNESAQQTDETTERPQAQAANAEPQDRELQRNQLEDRFNALTNDAPSPNIDVST